MKKPVNKLYQISCNENAETVQQRKELISSLKLQTVPVAAIDRYEILNTIEKGAYGTVYKVHDRVTNGVYAMKVVELEDNQITPDLRREISVLYDINHVNIVKLEKVYSYKGFILMIMEYLDKDLLKEILYGGKKDPENVKAWLRQLLSAVDYLHKKDLIHRDLKPENILLDGVGQNLKLADFGAVRELYDDAAVTPQVTTITFRAPEVLLGCQNYGKGIDMWAIGCTFAEIVEGRPLFGVGDGSDSEISVLHEIFKKIGSPSKKSWLFSLPHFPKHMPEYLKACEITPELDAVGNDLLLKLLCLDPNQRISAADALNHPYLKVVDK